MAASTDKGSLVFAGVVPRGVWICNIDPRTVLNDARTQGRQTFHKSFNGLGKLPAAGVIFIYIECFLGFCNGSSHLFFFHSSVRND